MFPPQYYIKRPDDFPAIGVLTNDAECQETHNCAPLAGIKMIEFSHMVMGLSCGMILADLGADVIKVEPGISR